MKDDTLTLVNSSYADVWDYLKKPMRAFLNQIGEKDGQVIDKSVSKGIYEAAKEFAAPFFTQNLAIEPIIDALPEELLGRGGTTTEGYGVYSETDKWPTKLGKSTANIIRQGMPGAILQAKKYGDIAYDIYQGRGDPDAAWQKFVSSITGRKIQKFDLLKIMKQKNVLGEDLEECSNDPKNFIVLRIGKQEDPNKLKMNLNIFKKKLLHNNKKFYNL